MMRSFLLIYLIFSSNSTLHSLLAKHDELTTKHDDIFNQLAIISNENKNYSPSNSPLHELNGRLANIKDASNKYSIDKAILNIEILDLKLAETEYFYKITVMKIQNRYSGSPNIEGNLLESNTQLTTLLQNLEKSIHLSNTKRNSLTQLQSVYRHNLTRSITQTRDLFKDEIENSKNLVCARSRIAKLSGSDILADMIFIEDAYNDEIYALSKNSKIFKQVEENLAKDKDIRVNYETDLLQFESEYNFCFKSLLRLIRYFGYSYSAIYLEEVLQKFDKFRKIVRILLDSVDKFFLGRHDSNLKRNMQQLKHYFEKLTENPVPLPLSFLNKDKNLEFSLPKLVTFKDEEQMKNKELI